MESSRKIINFAELWRQTDKKYSQNSPFWKPEKPQEHINKAADEALKNAKEAAIAAAPIATAVAVNMIGSGDGGGGFIRMDFRPIGVLLMPGAIGLDLIKAPFCLAVATEEAIRGGITKLVSLLFEKEPTQQAFDNIFKSFILRMQETAGLLISLGLEEKNVLDEKLKSGDIEELVGLSLLLSAYVSRHYNDGLLLAEEKTLARKDCPVEGLALFDAVMNLKALINEALRSVLEGDKIHRTKDEKNFEEARIVCQWIGDIKAGKALTAEQRPDATPKQLEIVNKIITQIEKLKMYGMMILPETPQNVVRKIK